MANYTWTGGTYDGDLDNPLNYSPNGIPTAGDSVTVGPESEGIYTGTSHADWSFPGPISIDGGTFNGHVAGTLSVRGGEFNGPVTNGDNGVISDAVFNGLVTNNGYVTGDGTFNGPVENDGDVTGGTFNNRIDNYGALEGGPITINGYLRNHNSWCEMSGVTFGPAASLRLGDGPVLRGPDHPEAGGPEAGSAESDAGFSGGQGGAVTSAVGRHGG